MVNQHRRNHSTGEQELLVVARALHHWRCYLEGAQKVRILTYRKPNTFLSSKTVVQLTKRQVHCQEFLSSFDFTWDYIKGKANVADPSSRHPAILNAVCGATSKLSESEIDLVLKLKERVPMTLLTRLRLATVVMIPSTQEL